NHSPIVFIKPQDKSSPLLMMAISDNETLNLKFDFYRTAQSGSQELYYSIECREATIIELSPNYPHSVNHAEAQPEEIVSIKYKDIICRHHMAGTSGYSVWDERVY
ncbi:type VI secretion system tube protein Hcp, partial [Enterobacter hormaechei]|nr:type VI secretion system tube protein Hcp [Enterobacter hormaechei]